MCFGSYLGARKSFVVENQYVEKIIGTLTTALLLLRYTPVEEYEIVSDRESK